MTREYARQILPMIVMFSESVTIQRGDIDRHSNMTWVDDDDPSFQPTVPWRIKPQPAELWRRTCTSTPEHHADSIFIIAKRCPECHITHYREVQP